MKARVAFHRNSIKYWLPVILWMCLIFWMSTETFSSQNTSFLVEAVLRFLTPEISSEGIGLAHTLIRKFGHVIEYFILGLLLFRAFRGGSTTSWKWRWSFLAAMVVLFYAATDEFHQSFVPTRTASGVDVSIDTIGGILAQCACALYHHHRKQ